MCRSINKLSEIDQTLIPPSFIETLHGLFAVLKSWSDEKLIATALWSSLGAGRIPPVYNPAAGAVNSASTTQLSTLLTACEAVAIKSSRFRSAMELGSAVVNLRESFNANLWSHGGVQKCISVLQHLCSSQTGFSELVEQELLNCQWHISYHAMIDALTDMCGAPSFSSVNVEEELYDTLLNSVEADMLLIGEARRLQVPHDTVFASLIDIAEKSITLKQVVHSKDFHQVM